MKTICNVLLLILTITSVVQGADYRSNDAVLVNTGDSLFTDLIAGGRHVDILGYVDGDVIAGCQKVTIEGEVVDDVLSGCQELSVKGKIGDMIIGFAQSILIDGEVRGDVIAFGAEVRITERAYIKGNLFLGTGKFRLEGGHIDGWIRGASGESYLNGSVGEKLELEGNKVQFGVGYQAAQGTKLILNKELDRETMENIPEDLEVIIKEKRAFYESGFFYWSLIAMLIVGILITIFFKNFILDLIKYTGDNILKNLGIGFIFILITPLIIIILLILVFTIPAALIVLALFLILLYLSSIFAGLYIGNYILALIRKDKSPAKLIWSLIIGMVLVVLLPKIPYIGFLINLAIICFGIGSIVAYLWNLKRVNTKAV